MLRNLQKSIVRSWWAGSQYKSVIYCPFLGNLLHVIQEVVWSLGRGDDESGRLSRSLCAVQAEQVHLHSAR
jgi:hypothetical protein